MLLHSKSTLEEQWKGKKLNEINKNEKVNPPVGLPPAGGFRRGWCSVIGLGGSRGRGALAAQSLGGDSSHGDMECHLTGGG